MSRCLSPGYRNAGLLLLVVAITVLPLMLYAPDEAAFAGADTKAQEQIGKLAPDYTPWLKPLLEPASEEIASLLFALQAAVGAGVIGYWLGASVTRERLRQAQADLQSAPPAACPAPPGAQELARSAPPPETVSHAD